MSFIHAEGEGHSQWKSPVYDKNSIFIIPNLHHDARFNLSRLGPQCTREMHTFLFWRPHWPESPARPGPQRYVSNDPGDLKSNICDIYFTQIASRLTRIVGCRLIICPGGDDNFSGRVARGRVWVATQFRMRRGWYNNETSWHLTPDVNADTILLCQ